MKQLHETDDGMIVHLSWDEYNAIQELANGLVEDE